ncbi:hypothetical protein ABZ128_09935 [Streptomyces sp. NPDC006326]|uniref:hypothetical protein n=1 Tax=Streptomyces sp. NPDC006326 TaxID=3156752 RepID=UPI0033ADAE8F
MMPHVAVNLIYVGWENFTDTDKAVVNAACWATRQTYWQVGFDIFGFDAYSISVADAQGYAYIDSDAEATWLTSDYTIPGRSVDVFLVKGYATSTAGLSPVPGPCNKYLTYPSMTGSVVELIGAGTNVAMPHEIGHYLGLHDDYSDPTNLMYYTVSSGGPSGLPVLTFAQGAQMAQHCFTSLP